MVATLKAFAMGLLQCTALRVLGLVPVVSESFGADENVNLLASLSCDVEL
jgi:hypothetical protein